MLRENNKIEMSSCSFSSVGRCLMDFVRSKVFVSVLFVLLSLLVLWPSLSVIPVLPQGDAGRDLYAFERTALGETPYRDFFWNYGPIMPYYYAAFLKIFGVSVKSALLGKMALKWLTALAIFLTGGLLISPVFSLLAALWVLVFCPDFVYTMNHIGAICVIMWTVYWHIRYLQTRRLAWLGAIMAGVFITALIKINAGLALAIASALSLFLIELSCPNGKRAQRLALAAAGLVMSLELAVGFCAVMTRGVPEDLLRQYFPLGAGYQQAASGNVIKALAERIIYDWQNGLSSDVCASTFYSPVPYRVLVLFLLGSVFAGTVFFLCRFWTGARQMFVGLAILLIYGVLFSHEFVLAPMPYSLWWICPLGVLFVFIVLGRIAGIVTVFVRKSLICLIVGILAVGISGIWQYQKHLVLHKKRFADLPKVGVCFNHSSQWRQTVEATVKFLNSRLAPGETFLALPYDQLYYYLTGRRAPVPEAMFFAFSHLSTGEEKRIIADLEREKVNYVLLSNRIVSDEPGLGVFGQTHCRELAKYILDNFSPVASFGDLQNQASNIEGHATAVYERNSKKN